MPYLCTLIVPARRDGVGTQPGTFRRGCPMIGGVTAGQVTFVGAGPGAPDLITLRGAAAIAAADIVIWASSLVHPGVLEHARPGAEIVDSAQLPMEGVLPYYERRPPRRRPAGGAGALW